MCGDIQSAVRERKVPMKFTQAQLETLQTPCFVFDQAELEANFCDFTQALRDAWSERAFVAYSVKTNPLPWIVSEARACGAYAEVVSDEEYACALECGYAPEHIVFNGPAKSRAWFEYAVMSGSIVNIDTRREVRWASELAQTHARPRVGIRVNIDLEQFCPGETIGGSEPGRFGFSYENGTAHQVVDELRSAGVQVCGLHMHVTTYGRTYEAYKILAHHAVRCVDEFNLHNSLSYIDMGGGYYGGGPQNAGRYEAYAEILAGELRRVCDPARVTLYVEPGGAVVCTPGYYVGRVIDTKDIGTRRFVVTELSRLNCDHEMKKTAYVHQLYTKKDILRSEQDICGFTCLESDRLCRLVNERELTEGDYIVFNYVGAYSISFTPDFFIKYPPAVYAYKDGAFMCLREIVIKQPPVIYRRLI